MKILVLANNDVGLYCFRGELIERMLQNGHQVHISLPDGEFVKVLQDKGCIYHDTNVDRRGINPIKDLRLFMQYLKLLKEVSPDLVITYTIKPNIYGGFASRLKGIRYVSNITGLGTTFQNKGLLRFIVVSMYRVALKRAERIFFENELNKQILINEKIATNEQSVLLNGAGVNLDKYNTDRYPEDDNITKFIFIGRVMKEKGVDELLNATKRLIDEGHSCHLDILGYYEEDYASDIQNYQHQGWLTYHGQQSDVRPYIENSHCFVLPSWHEGMANTNLESAAMQRPLITSRINGCMEAVVENESGFLCTPKDKDDLYEVMKRFIMLPYEEKRAMGKNGREHMEKVFDRQKVVDQTLKGLGLND